jgi:hypothetical protein
MKEHLLSLLLIAGLTTVTFSGPYEIVEKENAVTTYYNGQTLWTYTHDPAEGKPYFHPLSSTDGTKFTDLRPEDHPWHRGVWFSWKSINGVNYWEEDRKTGTSDGETRIVRVKRRVSKAKTIQIELDIDYVPVDSNAVVMKEQRRVIASPPDKTGSYTLDWSTTFQALDEDVVLTRTPPPNEPDGKPWGGYAGWSVRMNQDVKGGALLNSHGAEDADRQPAAWMLFKAPQGGSLLFMDHPQNLNYPAKWYLDTQMPYFSPAVIHDAPHTIKAGQSLTLRYRLLVAPVVLETERARKAWNAWAGTTKN